MAGGDYRGFRRAIRVDQTHARSRQVLPGTRAIERCLFTADNYQTQMGRQGKTLFAERVRQFMPIRGRQIDDGDAQFIASAKKVASGIDHVVCAQDYSRAANQSGINLFRAEIETERTELQYAIGGSDRVFTRRGFSKGRQRSVFDHYALRIAG